MMRNEIKVFLIFIVLTPLFICHQDEGVLNKEAFHFTEAKVVDEHQESQLKHRIELGARKQSSSRLKLNVGEQRTF